MSSWFQFRLAGGWLVLLILSISSLAHAEMTPRPGALDSRIRTALYNEDQVYRLRGFVGFHIEIVFEEGELFTGAGGGDLDGIAFAAHENHLILKPKATNVGTNLVIYTNRRAYHFDYAASADHPDSGQKNVIYAVRFIYPPNPTPAQTAAQDIDRALTRADDNRVRNFDYWFCGSASIKPIAASDDGVHTRFTFAARSELPAIFLLNEDGTESLVNFTVRDGDVLVHRIARKFVLRRGWLVGCVENKGFQGGGERLKTGTVSPGVKRERKESAP